MIRWIKDNDVMNLARNNISRLFSSAAHVCRSLMIAVVIGNNSVIKRKLKEQSNMEPSRAEVFIGEWRSGRRRQPVHSQMGFIEMCRTESVEAVSKFMRDEYMDPPPIMLPRYLAGKGRLDMLIFLQSKGLKLSCSEVSIACKKGRRDVVKYYLSAGIVKEWPYVADRILNMADDELVALMFADYDIVGNWIFQERLSLAACRLIAKYAPDKEFIADRGLANAAKYEDIPAMDFWVSQGARRFASVFCARSDLCPIIREYLLQKMSQEDINMALIGELRGYGEVIYSLAQRATNLEACAKYACDFQIMHSLGIVLKTMGRDVCLCGHSVEKHLRQ
jgi:hypothetical protein